MADEEQHTGVGVFLLPEASDPVVAASSEPAHLTTVWLGDMNDLDEDTIAKFQRELGAMGFKFQFITLAGFHALNYSMFDLAHGYARDGMTAYVDLQEREFAAEDRGYTATRHQREVGTGYFDDIATVVNPESSTTALKDSTESGQF